MQKGSPIMGLLLLFLFFDKNQLTGLCQFKHLTFLVPEILKLVSKSFKVQSVFPSKIYLGKSE